MLDVAYSTIVLDMDVQTVGDEVLSHHHARLNDTALLWEVLLAEVL